MSEGPSKYDGLVRAMMEDLAADAVFVVVVGGELGSGACPALRLFPGEPEANGVLVTSLSRALVKAGESLLEDYEVTRRKAAEQGVVL